MNDNLITHAKQLAQTLLPFTPSTDAELPQLSAAAVAKLIDHTVLKPETMASKISQICDEARQHNFASVCVNSIFVPQATEALKGTDVAICTVVGFPLGASLTAAKVAEATAAIELGATEIDMVLAIGMLKGEQYDTVYEDIAAVATACHAQNCILKVIIETCLLSDEEKVIACVLAQAAGADFVKTSTGFSSGGATIHDVALMRQVVGPEIGVKASGGVRTFLDAQKIVRAGASRIGASAGVAIVSGHIGKEDY